MAETRIMVISDAHLLPYEYVGALDSLGDNKLSAYSIDILNKVIDNTIEIKPDLLLVCGDMTFHGEKSGHDLSHSILKRAVDAGISVKVIPGNHDILNPLSFDEGKANVTPEQFAEIYKDMGYDDGVERDSNSLSWATSINDKLAIIGLDANIYDGKEYYSDGCIRASTLDWMKKQAAAFQNDGKMVIATVHEEIMDHFSTEVSYFGIPLNVQQSTVLPNTILNISHKHNPTVTEGDDAKDVTLDDVQTAFADAGIHYVLTGHFHVNNESKQTIKTSDGENFDLYDLSTGGLTSYPCFFRNVLVNEDDQTVNSTSTLLEMSVGDSDLQNKSKEAISNMDATYSQYGFSIISLIEENMAKENVEIFDGTEIYQDSTYEFASLTYTRIFNDKNWQPLFVPFASKYSDWSENFDLALPVQSKAGAMFFTQIADADTPLPANTLALIRLKSDKQEGGYSIKPSQEPVVIEPNSSVMEFDDYTIIGEYNATEVKDEYIIDKNKLILVSDSTTIKPMSWHMANNSNYNFETVDIYIDNVITSVNGLKTRVLKEDKIYDIHGKAIKKQKDLPKGVYIINGIKVLRKE